MLSSDAIVHHADALLHHTDAELHHTDAVLHHTYAELHHADTYTQTPIAQSNEEVLCYDVCIYHIQHAAAVQLAPRTHSATRTLASVPV